MAIPSELCAWLPRLAPWKGSRIYTILVCLLNKTVLLFCCHSSPKSSPAPASSCAQISRTPAFVFSLWPQENAPWAVLFPSKALLHVTPRERPAQGLRPGVPAEWRHSYCLFQLSLIYRTALTLVASRTLWPWLGDCTFLGWFPMPPPPLKKSTFLISEKLGQLSITCNSILLLLTETAQSALQRSCPHS